MSEHKIHTLVLRASPEEVEIMQEGIAAMREYLRLHGVPPEVELSPEAYDRLFQKMGIKNLSGKEFLKLRAELLAATEEVAKNDKS